MKTGLAVRIFGILLFVVLVFAIVCDALTKRGNPLFFAQIPGDHRVDGLDEGFAFVMNRTPSK